MPLPPVVVNRSSPVPLYYQVAEQIERAIFDGALAPGDRIANEVALAEELGLSRPTLRQAIQLLVDKGMLVRKRGVGTQVVHPPIKRTVELTSLYDDLRRSGHRLETRVLSCELLEADELVASRLRVPEGDPTWCLERLRSADGEPLALMRNSLPDGLLALSADELSKAGLYELMRAAGVRPSAAQQTIGARAATAAEARLLGERRGAPLLTGRRVTYDAAGRALELGDHVYRASRYSFEHVLAVR